CQQHTNYPPTF
nr:immunoglobulin light chain junction region [Macaca mulatta]